MSERQFPPGLTDAEKALYNWGESAIYHMNAMARLPSYAQEAASAWMLFQQHFHAWQKEVAERGATASQEVGLVE